MYFDYGTIIRIMDASRRASAGGHPPPLAIRPLQLSSGDEMAFVEEEAFNRRAYYREKCGKAKPPLDTWTSSGGKAGSTIILEEEECPSPLARRFRRRYGRIKRCSGSAFIMRYQKIVEIDRWDADSETGPTIYVVAKLKAPASVPPRRPLTAAGAAHTEDPAANREATPPKGVVGQICVSAEISTPESVKAVRGQLSVSHRRAKGKGMVEIPLLELSNNTVRSHVNYIDFRNKGSSQGTISNAANGGVVVSFLPPPHTAHTHNPRAFSAWRWLCLDT